MNQPSRSDAGFHLWIILVSVAVIAIVGVLVWRFAANVNLGGKLFGDTFGSQYPCTEREVAFTSPPLRMEELGYIRPLGAMLDGHVTPTDHVYVGPIKREVPDNTYPVLMPADGTIVEIGKMPAQYIGDRAGVNLAPEDHRIIVSFNCRYFSIFIHIHKLAEPLAKAIEGLQPGQNRSVSIDLKAGDTFGYIGGDTFDWTPLDMQTKLTGFIHPELYSREPWKINTISPFDLYTGALKAQLEAKSWRTVPPIGGKIDYDQPGKLIGTWFREGTNGYEGRDQSRYWDGHLSVVPDYINPAYTIVSVGNWDDKATQLLVKGTRDPADITAEDGMVKFELTTFSYEEKVDRRNGSKMQPVPQSMSIAGTIAFQVLPGEKLKVEKFIGQSAAEVSGFTAAAQIYER